ncbi:MAG: hypothetical protein H0U73_01605, partial [Tatlockia sp.]|nr:hypothetical protein [Tatlockia sp.]
MKSRSNEISLKPACMMINTILDKMLQTEQTDYSLVQSLSKIIETPPLFHDTKIEYTCSEQETINRLINVILKKDHLEIIEFIQTILKENLFTPYIQNYRDESGHKLATTLLLGFVYPSESNKNFYQYLSLHIKAKTSWLCPDNFNHKKEKKEKKFSVFFYVEFFDKQESLDFLTKKNDNSIAHYEVSFLRMLYGSNPEDIFDIVTQQLKNEDELVNNLVNAVCLCITTEGRDKTLLKFNEQLYFPINCSEAEKVRVQTSVELLFNKLKQPLKPNHENKLELFDEREELSEAILPIQSLILSNLRKKSHAAEYPGTSYQTQFYLPKYMDESLQKRIFEQRENIQIISELTHITNLTYLHRLLDTGIQSRKRLVKNQTPFFPAALSSHELADYDVVCFSPNDTDSLSMQSADKTNFPLRITIDFKKLLNIRKGEKGQIFVKEHDLLWQRKPSSKQDRSIHYGNSDFAKGEIPDEYYNPLSCGKLTLQIYRNSYGVKIVLEKERY